MGNRPQQRTVREGKLNATLEAMNFEMAKKTAIAMASFHHEYVEPLEKRILFIETIFGIRLVRWIRWMVYLGFRWVRETGRALWHRVFMAGTEPVPEEAEEPIQEDAPPEPEHDGVSRILSMNP